MSLNLRPATAAFTAELVRVAADAHATLTVIAAALRRLDEGQAGYPTAVTAGTAPAILTPVRTATGWACPARACTATGTHDTEWHQHWADEHGPTQSTHPERLALAGVDEATRDTTTLIAALHRASASMLAVRRIADKWGQTRIGERTTTTPADDLWCTSCLRANHFAPRRANGSTRCEWCDKTLRAVNKIRTANKLDALTAVPEAAVTKHAAARTVTAADIEAWARTNTPAAPRRGQRRTQREATDLLRATGHGVW